VSEANQSEPENIRLDHSTALCPKSSLFHRQKANPIVPANAVQSVCPCSSINGQLGVESKVTILLITKAGIE
jgi:hypothetical protein